MSQPGSLLPIAQPEPEQYTQYMTQGSSVNINKQ